MEVIKYYYGNDQSLTKTQRALMKIYPRELRNLSLKTIQRDVGKFERDLTLLPVRQTGRLKSVVTDRNVEKIRRSLEERPRRSLRDLSKQTKLSSSLRDFLRPSYPLDLNPCNFYLWGYLKVESILIQCPTTQNSSKKHQERGQAGQAEDSRIISRKFARPHSKSSVSGRVLVRADCKLLDFFRYLY